MDRSAFLMRISTLLGSGSPIAPFDLDGAIEGLMPLADRYLEALREAPAHVLPDHRTAVLITYGNAITSPGEHPLATLRRVLGEQVGRAFTTVHLLPMFPSTSDDGFAVVDYRRIDQELGSWEDVDALGSGYDLMFDFVANHVSSSSVWFSGWLARDSRYDGYFVEYEPRFDATVVTRPRTSPLFHDYERADGSVATAWTTFSADQVDVNISSVAALLDLTDVLLGYAARGASMIRLDAIGFLVKESGTTCMHRPGTHTVVQLWRAMLDYVRPGTQLITETNVAHADNISYFGNGHNEANMVYQFALPPLVLHSFITSDARALTQWAQSIQPISTTATYFNFLASHDGIGMRPCQGLLTADEQAAMISRTLANGGAISMKDNPDGTQSVYELNINFADALVAAEAMDDAVVVAAATLAAHSILLSLAGVPAIYYHSLFGSSGDRHGMASSGINRRINREVLDAAELAEELVSDPRRQVVLQGLKAMLAARASHPAFNPFSPQQVEQWHPSVFAVRRGMGTDDEILCLTNVSAEEITLDGSITEGAQFQNLTLAPFAHVWLAQHEAV